MTDLERVIARKRARAADLTGEAAAANARRLARLEAQLPPATAPVAEREPAVVEPAVEPEPEHTGDEIAEGF